MARVAADDDHFRDMSALYPTLQIAHCEHHCIFCLLRDDEPARTREDNYAQFVGKVAHTDVMDSRPNIMNKIAGLNFQRCS